MSDNVLAGLSIKLCDDDMGRVGSFVFELCFISLYVLADAPVVFLVCLDRTESVDAECPVSITTSKLSISSINVTTASTSPSGLGVGGRVCDALSLSFFLSLKDVIGEDCVISSGFLVGASLLASGNFLAAQSCFAIDE